ncbi:MAG: Gfo/Idh/MocA family oxidoreductase [Rhodospirillaceae bacterium]|nr:Gfo/Idh/MocA family oxidoreductase [Rhodospirillaceae bacterium]
MSPLRLGVLGAANIAKLFARGVAGSPLVSVDVVASRDAAKAAEFAKAESIPRSHGSYEALLADPAIEAIYIPLPNDLHAEWAIKAAAAGKHILCEKPLAMAAAEARAMYAAARTHGVHLVEAYPYMSQPQTLRMRELLAEIGRVQLVTAMFGFSLTTPEGRPLGDPANIRLNPARGGGGLRDAGTYSMSLARIAVGERPSRVMASAKWTESGVDRVIAATVEFPSGALAQVSCHMSGAFHRSAVIVGERGVIETSYLNHGPDGKLSLNIRRGTLGTVPLERLEVEGVNGFRAEAESFARLVRQGPAHWNGASEAESIDIVLALDAIAASARSGGWETVAA